MKIMKIKLNKVFILFLQIFIFSVSFGDTKNNQQLENNIQIENIENEAASQTPDKTNIEVVESLSETNSSQSKKKTKPAFSFKKKDFNNILWRLIDISENDSSSENKKIIITLYLSSNGNLNGIVGDNGYFGRYRLSGNNISISLIGNPVDDNAIEEEYLNALKNVSSLEVNDGILILKSKNSTLKFQKIK